MNHDWLIDLSQNHLNVYNETMPILITLNKMAKNKNNDRKKLYPFMVHPLTASSQVVS